MIKDQKRERARQELLGRINSFEYWHYPFDLGDGVYVVPTHGWLTAAQEMRDFIWPVITEDCGGDLKGLRVLDIGCNAGFWSLEAIKSGAAYVLGIDASETAIAQAELIRDTLAISSEAWELRRLDIYEVSRAAIGEFDLCLVFRVLHHLAHPLLALERVREVCRRHLVLDVALHQQTEAMFGLRTYNPKEPFGGVSTGLALRPSRSAIEPILTWSGFANTRFVTPKPPLTNKEYYEGKRAFIMATTSSSLELL